MLGKFGHSGTVHLCASATPDWNVVASVHLLTAIVSYIVNVYPGCLARHVLEKLFCIVKEDGVPNAQSQAQVLQSLPPALQKTISKSKSQILLSN